MLADFNVKVDGSVLPDANVAIEFRCGDGARGVCDCDVNCESDRRFLEWLTQ
jgi:hypothetical protein